MRANCSSVSCWWRPWRLSIGRSTPYPFVLLDDHGYVLVENPYRPPRTDLRGRGPCLHGHYRGQLASAHDALPHARLPTVRRRGRGGLAPRSTSCVHAANTVLLFIAWGGLRGPFGEAPWWLCFWTAPAARRIGRLGRGTQGRSQHAILHVHPLGLSPLCPSADWLFRDAAVFVLLVLGLMCKPMLVTVPLVLLLLDYWPWQGGWAWGLGTRGGTVASTLAPSL